MPLKRQFSPFLTNLDLALARTVNGATAGRMVNLCCGHLGAIAQLGERIVRNDEVGGSIPPGSTSLRRLRQLRLGKPIVAKAAAAKPEGRSRAVSAHPLTSP